MLKTLEAARKIIKLKELLETEEKLKNQMLDKFQKASKDPDAAPDTLYKSIEKDLEKLRPIPPKLYAIRSELLTWERTFGTMLRVSDTSMETMRAVFNDFVEKYNKKNPQFKVRAEDYKF